MDAVIEDLELSEEELIKLTRYRLASKQMQFLKEAGIPAKLRRDNTVLVLRMHVRYPTNPQVPIDGPKLKSSRK